MFIDVLCTRCDKTNILFVKRRNTAHIAKQKLSNKVFSTLLKTKTNELRCANAGND